MLDTSLTVSLLEGFAHCTLSISTGSISGTQADCDRSQVAKTESFIIDRFSFQHVLSGADSLFSDWTVKSFSRGCKFTVPTYRSSSVHARQTKSSSPNMSIVLQFIFIQS